MKLSQLVHFVGLVALTSIADLSQAELYKCTDEKGVTTYVTSMTSQPRASTCKSLKPPPPTGTPSGQQFDIDLVCQVRPSGIVSGNIGVSPNESTLRVLIKSHKNKSGTADTFSGQLIDGTYPRFFSKVTVSESTIGMKDDVARSEWDHWLSSGYKFVEAFNGVVINRMTGDINYYVEGRTTESGGFVIGYSGKCERFSAHNRRF